MPSAATSATASPAPTAAASRKPRSDGVEARSRLLHTALRLFAQKGFAKTSTREIAQAAGTNLAAIAYYFGDKTGLYSACFSEPMGDTRALIDHFSQPGLSLRAALTLFFTAYLEPLKQDDLAQDCLRLHLREMLEPTSQWAVELERDIRQPHVALVALLCRHLGVARADDEVHRLAFSLVGLPIQLFVSREIIAAIRPSLVSSPRAIDKWATPMVEQGLAMVAVEHARRDAARQSKGPTT